MGFSQSILAWIRRDVNSPNQNRRVKEFAIEMVYVLCYNVFIEGKRGHGYAGIEITSEQRSRLSANG